MSDPGTPGHAPDHARRRSPLRLVLAIGMILAGSVWILQGLGILTAGGSFMIGDRTWAVIGAVFVALGAGLALRGRRS